MRTSFSRRLSQPIAMPSRPSPGLAATKASWTSVGETVFGAAGEPGRLNGAGLIIINPPWRLADELGQLLPVLGPLLRPGAKAVTVDWLAGES